MSQIYKTLTSSGPIPPIIPTSFTTDTQEDFLYNTGDGFATPAANVLQIYGDNGIETVTNDTDTDVVQFRFSRGTAQTVNIETVTVLSFIVPTDSVMTMKVLINGISLNDGAIGGEVITTVKNIGGVVTRIDNNDFILDTDTLTGATAEIDVSGTTVRVRATGMSGETIDWQACTPGIIDTAHP